MYNKQSILLAILLLAFSLTVFGQKWKLNRYEIYGGLGSANFFGDIGGSADVNNMFGLKDLKINTTGPSMYFAASYRINPSFTAKIDVVYGYMMGNDEGSLNGLNGRDLVFRTNAIETSTQIEYSIITDVNRKTSFARFNSKGMLNSQNIFNLYVFTGFGNLFYAPSVSGNSAIGNVGVQQFAGNTLVIPAGIGFKTNIQPRISINLELGGRYTFSDFVDGYASQYSKYNDVYYFFAATLSYKLRTGRNGWPIIFPNGRPDWLKFGGKLGVF